MPYLIVPSGSITVALDPPQTGSGETLRNGAQIDPQVFQEDSGYDGRITAHFNAGVVAGDYITVSAGQTIVKTRSQPILTDNGVREGVLSDIGVCHIVAEAPTKPAGHTLFAPPTIGWTGRTLQFRSVDIPALIATRVTPKAVDVSGFASVPDFETVMTMLDRPAPLYAQNIGATGSGYEALWPHKYGGPLTYGRTTGIAQNDANVLLFSNATNDAQKAEILVRKIRAGIDADDPFIGGGRIVGNNGGHHQIHQDDVIMKRVAFGKSLTGFMSTICGNWGQCFMHTAQTIAEVTTPHNGGNSTAYLDSPLPWWSRRHQVTAVDGNTITFANTAFNQSSRVDVRTQAWLVQESTGDQVTVISISPNDKGEIGRGSTYQPTELTLDAQPAAPFQIGDWFYFIPKVPLVMGNADWLVGASNALIDTTFGTFKPGMQQYRDEQLALGIKVWAADAFAGGLPAEFAPVVAYVLAAQAGDFPPVVDNRHLEFWNAASSSLTVPT